MLVQKIDQEYNYPLTQELARVQIKNEKILAKYFSNDNNNYSVVHSHPFFELITPISGSESLYAVNGNVYRVSLGDIIFIPQEIYHLATKEDDLKASNRLVVQIDSGLWKKALAHTGLKNPVWNRQITVVNKTTATKWDLRGLFERMINTQHMKKEFQATVLEGQLVELQMLLEQSITDKSTVAPSSTSLLVSKTVSYIQEHYTDPTLTVQKLAQEAFVSREYLSRIFKEYTMESIHSYLTNLRIQHSLNAITAGRGLLEASMESGFNNYSSFFKSFRSMYGFSPAEYKKQLSSSLEKES